MNAHDDVLAITCPACGDPAEHPDCESCGAPLNGFLANLPDGMKRARRWLLDDALTIAKFPRGERGRA